jgi:alcohol dehydrogenase
VTVPHQRRILTMNRGSATLKSALYKAGGQSELLLSMTPAAIYMIDLDDKRLAVARKFGATTLINSSDGHAAQKVMEITEGAGVDVAIEAVGLPTTFAICQAIVAAGGRIANVGVHGKPVELHMEKLWDRNISLTTRLVDTVTTPMLLKVVRSGKLQPDKLVTHRFAMNDILKAYDTFGNAAKEGALKVVLQNSCSECDPDHNAA